jgi:mannose/fructose/sorbose-specific phosphotransferase system IIA component
LISIIIVGHGNFASELVSISQTILGKQKYLEIVSIKAGEGEHALHSRLTELMDTMEIDDVMILSDIFGGSISNMCLYFAKRKGHVAVVTGVNLPMVLKVLTYRDRVNLKELVSLACKGGKDGIVDACELIDEKQ